MYDREGRTEEQLQLVVDAMALWFSLGYEPEGERRLEASSPQPRRTPGAAGGPCLPVLVRRGARSHRVRISPSRPSRWHRTRGTTLPWLSRSASEPRGAPDAAAMRRDSLQITALAEGLRGTPVRYADAAPDALVREAADNMSAYDRFRDVREALRWEERAVAAAERGGDHRQLARHLAELSFQHLLAGDADEAREIATRARSLIGTSGNGRWEDDVALANALVLFHRGEYAAAEIALRELIGSGLAGGRPLHVHFASCFLADLLLHQDAAPRGRRRAAAGGGATGRRRGPAAAHAPARPPVPVAPDGGSRPASRTTMLKETEKGIDTTELTLEHVIWLVEQALTAESATDRCAWIERLDALSQQTGVQVPPWERRWLKRSR